MPPIRTVAHAIHSGGFYGAEKVICDLMALQNRDSDIRCLLLAFMDPQQVDNAIARRIADSDLPVFRFHCPPKASPGALLGYSRLLRALGIDLVHTHGYKPAFFHATSRKLGLHDVPALATAHGYAKDSGSWKSRAYHQLDMFLMRSMERVVAVSGELCEYISVRNPACKPQTIPNGIGTQIKTRGTRPARALLPPERRDLPIIGSVGRLVRMKNHQLLIRAFADLRRHMPCELFIVGDGPLRGELEALWSSLLPGEPIHIMPFQEDILEWVEDFDAFCLPSNDGEGLPMALLEAGLLGKPVICSRSGGIPEVLRHGDNGLLFPLGDQKELETQLITALSSREYSSALGATLKSDVLSRHTMETTWKRYRALYQEILISRNNEIGGSGEAAGSAKSALLRNAWRRTAA